MLNASGASARDRLGAGLLIIVMLAALAQLFDRTWQRGERLSPADLVLTAFPWAADTTRVTPKNPVRSDEAYYFEPIGITHFDRLRHGDFPDLDPYVLSGIPAFHHGLDVGRAYSPLSLPFYFFDNALATTLYAPLRLLLAALCMWWWLRWIGVGRVGAIAGGVAFGLNGAFIVWLSSPQPNVGLFLPLLALGADRIVTRTDRQGVAIFAIAFGMMWIGGYTPTLIIASVAVAMMIAVWLVARIRTGGVAVARVPLALLVLASIAGLAVGAVSLFPTVANLASSSIVTRTMGQTLPWENVATFVLPNFWGTPIAQNWWYPGDGNYSEFVTYLGVTTIALAGAGLASMRRLGVARWLGVVLVGVVAACAMYGVPPVTWLTAMPPLRQTNPYRWHVVLAFAVATLAAAGVDVLVGSDADGSAASSMRQRRRAWALAGMVGAIGLMGGLTALALQVRIDDIRRVGLQAFEQAQLLRAAQVTAVALGLAAVAALVGRIRWLAGAGLIVVVAFDLVKGGYGFNPTLPPGRIFPPTPILDTLREATGQGRVAFAGDADTVWPTHAWGVYGLQAVDGHDFYGDGPYQHFMQRASARREEPAGWAYVEPGPPERLRVPMLDLLNVTTIATPPIDTATQGVGYTPLGELTDGRHVEQPFTARFNGLRAVDVLTATYGRYNAGVFKVSLRDADDITVASRDIGAGTLLDNGWTRLEFPPIANSGGRRFRIVIDASGATADRAATIWMTAASVDPDRRAVVDGAVDARSAWFRTFSSAPERIPGATLIESDALNIYRSNAALPRAWSVPLVEIAPFATHLDRVADPSFNARQIAVLTEAPEHPATESAQVTSIDTSSPDVRRIALDAPDGGLVIVSERHTPRWRASVDGQPARVQVANHLLVAVAVPPGARELVLEFRDPTRRPAEVVTFLALAGIVLALRLRS